MLSKIQGFQKHKAKICIVQIKKKKKKICLSYQIEIIVNIKKKKLSV